jgi:hypothetical protein
LRLKSILLDIEARKIKNEKLEDESPLIQALLPLRMKPDVIDGNFQDSLTQDFFLKNKKIESDETTTTTIAPRAPKTLKNLENEELLEDENEDSLKDIFIMKHDEETTVSKIWKFENPDDIDDREEEDFRKYLEDKEKESLSKFDDETTTTTIAPRIPKKWKVEEKAVQKMFIEIFPYVSSLLFSICLLISVFVLYRTYSVLKKSGNGVRPQIRYQRCIRSHDNDEEMIIGGRKIIIKKIPLKFSRKEDDDVKPLI